MKSFFLFFCLFSSLFLSHAQSSWEKASDKEGILIYTRTVGEKQLKEFKAHMNIDARISTVASLVTTASNYHNWVYKVSKVEVLKGKAPKDSWSYYTVDMPWPLNDRDGVSHTTIKQETHDKVIISQSSESDYLPKKAGFVRLQYVKSSWVLERLESGKLSITYQSIADPGELPTWLVNAFILDSPKETFRALRKEVKKPAFAQAELDWIHE